jgi:hypothetical protein
MNRRAAIALASMLSLFAGCATDGAVSGGPSMYGDYWFYDDWWYSGGGCCVDYPGDIGPPGPHPEHPIALPPGSTPRPEQPIAKPPTAEPRASTATKSMPAPRASAPMRGGGGGRGGGRR